MHCFSKIIFVFLFFLCFQLKNFGQEPESNLNFRSILGVGYNSPFRYTHLGIPGLDVRSFNLAYKRCISQNHSLFLNTELFYGDDFNHSKHIHGAFVGVQKNFCIGDKFFFMFGSAIGYGYGSMNYIDETGSQTPFYASYNVLLALNNEFYFNVTKNISFSVLVSPQLSYRVHEERREMTKLENSQAIHGSFLHLFGFRLSFKI